MAAPLWRLAGDPSDSGNRQYFRTPTILRFASDSFMEEFTNLLNTEPQRLNEYVAAPETWNSPPGEPDAPVQKSGLALKLFRARNAAIRRLEARGTRVVGKPQTSPSAKILKLYQPAHQRFYLVSTCLVCRRLGLPDRRLDAAAHEKATFVLRMLQPHATADPKNPDPRDCDELALVKGAWRLASNPTSFVEGEEQHPLFPAAYGEDDQRRRRLLAGLIPVGDRERLLQAVQLNPGGQSFLTPHKETRQMMLKTQVIGPMKSLEDLAAASVQLVNTPVVVGSSPSAQAKQDSLDRTNDQIQQVSWYILLDLARYLQTNLPNLFDAIQGKSVRLPAAQQTILNTLSQTMYSATSLLSAVQLAYAASDSLESIKTKYDSKGNTAGWPSFRFQFYKAATSGVLYLQPSLDRKVFEDQIVQALPEIDSNPPLPARSVAQANANPQPNAWFTIRCVLERPNCGSLTPPLVSEPTAAFQLAAFFDPDAPSRPIRIGLPVDTTPAGLRKFDKNTAFVMSDTLCGQVNKMGSMSFLDLVLSVLPFPFHSDIPKSGGEPCTDSGGISAGLVCSFSIPIITICALILLIIFVKLLDIIFFWMPFFQICLPVPKLSAKE